MTEAAAEHEDDNPNPNPNILLEFESLRPETLNFCNAHELAESEKEALRINNLEADQVVKEQEDICDARVSELIDEQSKTNATVSEILASVRSVHAILDKILTKTSDDEVEQAAIDQSLNTSSNDHALQALAVEAAHVCKIGREVELKFAESEDARKKVKDLENTVLDLTEENKDLSSMLKSAIAEKEAAEKKKGGAGEQKKGGIMQIAEMGLQRVGFGFVMGVMGGDGQKDDQISSSTASVRYDSSECDEEIVSLVSTVENIMKKLRLEVSDLRRALEESRSACEHVQVLAAEQARKIVEHELYIGDLEERKNLLVQNVESLSVHVTKAEEDVVRWRDACELEVEAGKVAIKERDNELALLREELKRTKASLDTANNKLHIKERLAATAMAAQAAAYACVQLADNRSAGLQQRIDELTKQLEEETDNGKMQRKGQHKRARHVCWPWQGLKVIPSAARTTSRLTDRSSKLLLEKEALLRIRI